MCRFSRLFLCHILSCLSALSFLPLFCLPYTLLPAFFLVFITSVVALDGVHTNTHTYTYKCIYVFVMLRCIVPSPFLRMANACSNCVKYSSSCAVLHEYVCVWLCFSPLSAWEIRSQPHSFHYVARILNLSYAKINAPKRSCETTSLKPATPINKDLHFLLYTFALAFFSPPEYSTVHSCGVKWKIIGKFKTFTNTSIFCGVECWLLVVGQVKVLSSHL